MATNKLPFPQTLVAIIFIINFINYNGVEGMLKNVGNQNMVPSPTNVSGPYNQKNMPKSPSIVSFNHPKATPQKLKISTKATSDHHKIAASADSIVREVINTPQEEISIKNAKMFFVEPTKEEEINNLANINNKKEAIKQIEEVKEKETTYSNLIKEISWDMTESKKIVLDDEKNKIIQTVANILVPYVEKPYKDEGRTQIAEAAGRYIVFALIEAKRINKYKEIVENIEGRVKELEFKNKENGQEEAENGGERVEKVGDLKL
uniref:Uncharacterized protein n=1 Tax=Meloidogyne hapla TaxID=6305 RepID=A0A1I8C1N8_MELHA